MALSYLGEFTCTSIEISNNINFMTHIHGGLFQVLNINLATPKVIKFTGSSLPYSGYFSWGITFVIFVVVKETTNIFLTKIYY